MSLLQMSFSGAVMILTVVVIRALALHKLPKKTFLVLWSVVLVRLLVPYSVPSAFSVYSLVGRLPSTVIQTTVTPVAPAAPAFPFENMTPGTTTFAPMPSVPAFDPWVAVWLMGVLGCSIFFAVAYFKCRRKFQTSLPVSNDYAKRWLQTHRLHRPVTIRQSDRISAPLTYGVFRPVILMPKTADWADKETLAYVLGHEYVHIRRFDAVTKLALTSALCIHWFNPMVWIMYVLANRDIELSCDEAVIHGFGERTKSAYAMTLIHMEETRSGLSPLCNHFSKNAIEERIVAIMKIKKTSLLALFVAVALVIGVTTAFATSGQAAAIEGPDKNDIANAGQTIMNGYTVMSYTNPTDGKTYYSMDEGSTWTPITDEELLPFVREIFRHGMSVSCRATTGNAGQTVMNEYTVMSYTNPADGKTYCSMDEGSTWTLMTDEELLPFIREIFKHGVSCRATIGWDDVEWWIKRLLGVSRP